VAEGHGTLLKMPSKSTNCGFSHYVFLCELTVYCFLIQVFRAKERIDQELMERFNPQNSTETVNKDKKQDSGS
jgi:hypothetical protein